MFAYAEVICWSRKHGTVTSSLEFTQQEQEKLCFLIFSANQYNTKTKSTNNDLGFFVPENF